MYLFFDTETTGLSSTSNHIVQLAWVLAADQNTVISHGNLIVKPDGYEIPWQASKIHGITTADAHARGKPLQHVLEIFTRDAMRGELLVAHNMSFDFGFLQTAYCRVGRQSPLSGRATVCTMRSTTQWCRLPKPSGHAGYKWPKLTELHTKLFGKDFSSAHDASADVQACMRCYFELVKRGVIAKPTAFSSPSTAKPQPRQATTVTSVKPSSSVAPPATSGSPVNPVQAAPRPQKTAPPGPSPVAPPTQTTKPAPPPAKRLVTSDDEDNFGEDLVDLIRRICLATYNEGENPVSILERYRRVTDDLVVNADLDNFGSDLIQMAFSIAVCALKVLRPSARAAQQFTLFDRGAAEDDFGDDLLDLMVRVAVETYGGAEKFESTDKFFRSVLVQRNQEIIARRPALVKAATDPKTTPAFLADLVTIEDEEISICVAKNHATPADILQRLLDSRFKDEVKVFVLAHHNCPKHLIAEAQERAAAFHPATAEDLADKNWIEKTLIPLLKNPATPVDAIGIIYWRWYKVAAVKELIENPVYRNEDVLVAALDLLNKRDFAIRFAKCINSSWQILKYLAGHQSWVVRKYVAGNTSSPIAVIGALENITQKNDVSFCNIERYKEKTDEIFSTDLEDQFPEFGSAHVRIAALSNAKSPSRDAKDPGISIERLEELARSKWKSVRISVAENCQATAHILDLLAADSDRDVRLAAAKSEMLETASLERLGADEDEEVLITALTRLLLNDPDRFKKLLKSVSLNVAKQVKLNTAGSASASVTALASLMNDPDPQVRAVVAKAPRLPKYLVKEMASDQNANVRAAVAARAKNITEDIFRYLLFDESEEVRLSVLHNPNCSRQALEWLTKRKDTLTVNERKLLCRHQNAPDSLVAIFIQFEPEGVRLDMAKQLDCPEAVMCALARDPVPEVRLAVLENPSCSSKVIDVFAADEIREWRIFAAKHDRCSAKCLAKLSSDPDLIVRRATAQRV